MPASRRYVLPLERSRPVPSRLPTLSARVPPALSGGRVARARSGLVVVVALLALVPRPGLAQLAGCGAVFAAGQPPVLINQRLAQRTHAMCFGSFALLASGVTRGPLWSAEHLTRDSIDSARVVARVDAFHAEETLPEEDRGDPRDFVRSGYDRGHMSPSGDMPDAASQRASFSMANMVPQAPKLNRGIWARIETAVRDLAQQGAPGEVYVVTGPVFRGQALQSLAGGELVPSAVFKAVVEPGLGAAAYVCSNRNAPRCRVVSIARLSVLTGIDPFPSLSAAARITPIDLPRPKPARRRHRNTTGILP